MDFETECDGRMIFRLFVCMCLTTILGLHLYPYLWGPQDLLEGDFSDIKYIVTQLTRGLSEVNRKHERLQSEIDRLTVALPAVTAAASRTKDALQPTIRKTNQNVQLHDYDRQVVDYAMESAGARILDTGSTIDHMTYESVVSWVLHTVVSMMSRSSSNAATILRPGSLPGECWAFKGDKGEAMIRLLGMVHVTGFSIEHIPPHISPTREISAAPRHVILEGLEYRKDPRPHEFGSFEYNKDGKPIQYFEVQRPASRGYNLVRVRVVSNWGNSVYTCIYRVRVHGELVKGQAPRQSPQSIEDGDLRIENE